MGNRCKQWMRADRAVMLLIAMLAIGGCAFKGGPTAGGSVGANAGGGAGDAWHPSPVSLRVFPTSRFVVEGRTPVLEARVELRDEMGDAVKSSGNMRLELFTTPRSGEPVAVKELYTWDVTMRSAEDQRIHFDTVTRTYLYRLKSDDSSSAHSRLLLNVIFTRPDGQRITGSGVIDGQPRLPERPGAPTG